jgi:hypothetical protein
LVFKGLAIVDSLRRSDQPVSQDKKLRSVENEVFMTSQIFIDNITVIDLSRWSFKERGFVGDSFNLHCRIGGALNPTEGVVIDFSGGKKKIKQVIDEHVTAAHEVPLENLLASNGFDHKLVLPTDPMFRALSSEESRLAESCRFAIARTSDTHCSITALGSRGPALNVPFDSVKPIPADVLLDVERGDVGSFKRMLSLFLEARLNGLRCLPVVDRKPHTSVVEDILGPDYRIQSYSYTHGLRNSSSFGCQNILHGHQSFVASSDAEEAALIARYLDRTHIYDGATREGGGVTLAYETDARGEFSYRLATDYPARLLDIRTEPTIENIAGFVADALEIRCPFFLSEGLQKGCFWEP